jgi:Protein of unknown function (DUF742)
VTVPPGMDDAGSPRIRPFLGGTDPAAVRPRSPAGPLTEPTALRPYVMTGGRVQAADPSIGIETQVTQRRDRPVPPLPAELAAIVALCTEPISVAEISARLGLHLGVTRILVGDLRAAGLVNVHTQDATLPHSPEIILRVMRGLRAIS